MRKLLSLLYRRMGWPSHDAVFVRGEEQPWCYTLGDVPPEGTVVEVLTISTELANDPQRLAWLRDVCKIRFASEGDWKPPEAI